MQSDISLYNIFTVLQLLEIVSVETWSLKEISVGKKRKDARFGGDKGSHLVEKLKSPIKLGHSRFNL